MNEVRLIDATALKYKNLAEVNGRLTYVLTAEEIDNAQTIEISGLPKIHYDRGFIAGYEKGKAERPQGEWVDQEYRRYLPRDAEPDYNDDTYDEKTHSVMSTHIVCSNCGSERKFYHNFCGNCGAEMKGGSE